jgi:hypothetical protein
MMRDDNMKCDGGSPDRISNRYRLFIILSIFALAAILIAIAAGILKTKAEHTDAETNQIATERRNQIMAELAGLSGEPEWAGEYYEGDGLGENVTLILSPKAGYLFEWRGCLGLYGHNYGAVTAANDTLHLAFTLENRRGTGGIAEEFTPVAWGDRQYLIPSNDIVGFCNQVNAGWEPRDDMHGRYLLRRGDEAKKVAGWPKLPPQYEAHLLKLPVEAKITQIGKVTTRPSVSDWNFRDTVVVLDTRNPDRLRVGMELHVVYPEHIVESARITKIEGSTAEAIMIQMESELAPLVGWKLSTSPPWRTAEEIEATRPAVAEETTQPTE